jgi:cytochrome c oxidase subunit 4
MTATARRHVSARAYVLTWLALLALTALTFLLSRQELGSLEVPAALAIALLKGGLVAVFFMHLLEQRSVNAFFFVVGVLFVVLLVGLTAADVVTREPQALPRRTP